MDRKPDGFPIPKSHGLVGNVDWGESLAVVSYDFPGLNSSGARRRAASEWLAVETCFSQDYPTNRCFEACNLTQVLTGFSYTFEVRKPVLTLCWFYSDFVLIPVPMAGINANQPNPLPAWKARTPLNLTPPLHNLP